MGILGWIGRQGRAVGSGIADAAEGVADGIGTAYEVTKNIVRNDLGLGNSTAPVQGKSPEELEAIRAQAAADGARYAALHKGAKGVETGILNAAEYTEGIAVGLNEFFTGNPSEAATKEYRETQAKVDGLLVAKDDLGLINEYNAQVRASTEVMAHKLKVAERNDEVEKAQALRKMISDMSKGHILVPGQVLNDEQRIEVAKDAKLLAGARARDKVKRADEFGTKAAGLTEDVMVKGFKFVADKVAPGSSVLMDGALAAAGQSGALGKRLDGEPEYGDTAAKIIRGDGTMEDVVKLAEQAPALPSAKPAAGAAKAGVTRVDKMLGAGKDLAKDKAADLAKRKALDLAGKKLNGLFGEDGVTPVSADGTGLPAGVIIGVAITGAIPQPEEGVEIPVAVTRVGAKPVAPAEAKESPASNDPNAGGTGKGAGNFGEGKGPGEAAPEPLREQGPKPRPVPVAEPAPEEAVKPIAQNRLRAMVNMVRRFDKDRDGALSREELDKAMSKPRANRVLSAMDTDGDGKISDAELKAANEQMAAAKTNSSRSSSSRSSSSRGGMRLRPSLAAFDKDGNGKLSKEELIPLIQSLDKDGDGQVTVRELMQGKTGLSVAQLGNMLKDAGIEYQTVSDGKKTYAVQLTPAVTTVEKNDPQR